MAELFFGDFRFDTRGLLLEGPQGTVEVRAKTLELLTFLIENRNRFVPRSELMERLWPDVTVTESSLTQCVSELRQALGDSARQAAYVETRVKQGYRFTATVFHRPTERLEPLPPPPGAAGGEGCQRLSDGRKRVIGWTALVLLVVVVAAFWQLTTRLGSGPPALRVDLAAGDPALDKRLGQPIAHAVAERLVAGGDVTVIGEAVSATEGEDLLVQIRCRAMHELRVEITATLLRQPQAAQLWGWTWVVPADDHDSQATVAEVADRVAAAVEATAATW